MRLTLATSIMLALTIMPAVAHPGDHIEFSGPALAAHVASDPFHSVAVAVACFIVLAVVYGGARRIAARRVR